MQDIYIVVASIHVMWIGMWIHHYTAIVTSLGLDFGMSSVGILGQGQTETMPLCGG